MKKKIFMACAALVVSAAAVVGVKAYSSSTYSLLDANLEAIASNEGSNKWYSNCFANDASDASGAGLKDLPICEEGTSMKNPWPTEDEKPYKAVYPCNKDTNITGDLYSLMGFCY